MKLWLRVKSGLSDYFTLLNDKNFIWGFVETFDRSMTYGGGRLLIPVMLTRSSTRKILNNRLKPS